MSIIEKLEQEIKNWGYGNLQLHANGQAGQIIFFGDDVACVDGSSVIVVANMEGKIIDITEL